jgi:hypothetical protein
MSSELLGIMIDVFVISLSLSRKIKTQYDEKATTAVKSSLHLTIISSRLKSIFNKLRITLSFYGAMTLCTVEVRSHGEVE